MEDDLPDLMTALRHVWEWFDLGLQLRVPYSTLKKIEQEQQMKGVERCKTELLVAWLQGQGGETSKQFLETALRNSGHNLTTGHH